MKFIYIDESGSAGDGDIFIMCGLLVDAYKLRKKTADFDVMLARLLARHTGLRSELKTSKFINGRDGWSRIDPEERKRFLSEVCRLAVANGGKLFGIGVSFDAWRQVQNDGDEQPFGNSYWLASAMFTACLVQKKMQRVSSSKGLTVVIMDDNKQGMPAFSDGLYRANAWYDGLYQVRQMVQNTAWKPRQDADRFDQIVNTAFAIKSEHSSLVQVADAICYVYRRHLELRSENEEWEGEQNYYAGLAGLLDTHREKLGQCPDAPCVRFYRAVRHPEWVL